MKYFYLLLLLISLQVSAQTILYNENFDDANDMDGYQLLNGASNPINFSGNASSYVKRDLPTNFNLGHTPSGFTGKVIAAENTDDELGFFLPMIVTDNIDISGEVDLKISMKLAVPRCLDGFIYEESDYLKVEYKIDAGAWTQALYFQGTGNSGGFRVYHDVLNNTVTGTGDDVLCTEDASEYEFSVPTTGNSMQIRVEIASWGDNEEFVFDDLMVTATPPCTDVIYNQTVEDCDSVLFEGNYYTSNTEVRDTTFGVINGCDSITVTTINVFQPDENLILLDAYDNDTVCTNAGQITFPNATPTGGYFTGIGTVFGDHFEPASVTPGTYWTLYTIQDANGCYVSDSTDITVEDCASIADQEVYSILVFPNPAKDVIYLQGVDFNTPLEIWNLQGKLVKSELYKGQVSVGDLPKGQYVLRVRLSNKLMQSLIVIG